MADYSSSNPLSSWKNLLDVAKTNKTETETGKWFDWEITNSSGNGKCKIVNVGYYLGMKDRTKTLIFNSGTGDTESRTVKQLYKPFWAAQNQTVGASKGDESRALELQDVGQAFGMSNYNTLEFAVYNAQGTKLIDGTDYALIVQCEYTSVDNPTSPYPKEYPYYFSVRILLTPNSTSLTKTFYLVGCKANGSPLPQTIGTSYLSVSTSEYHFQDDGSYMVFKIQQKGTSVTFDVTPDMITFASNAVATNKDYFEVTSGGSWQVVETDLGGSNS